MECNWLAPFTTTPVVTEIVWRRGPCLNFWTLKEIINHLPVAVSTSASTHLLTQHWTAVQHKVKTTSVRVWRVCRCLTQAKVQKEERELTAATHLIAVGNHSFLRFHFPPQTGASGFLALPVFLPSRMKKVDTSKLSFPPFLLYPDKLGHVWNKVSSKHRQN